MDSKKKGTTVDTIDLSDLSFAGTMADDLQPLTISSISLTDSISGPNGPTYSISGSTLTGGPYIGAGAIGANAIWTTSGTGTNGSWSDLTYKSSISQSGTVELRGENADIKVNGKSLMNTLEAIEHRLGMLTPNPEMEKEWDELRELAERYRELEKQCIEKSKMWNKLKTMPPPEVK